MSDFKPGDAVLINGTLAAVIETYEPDLDLIRFVSKANSQTDTTTAHISQTQIQHLVSDVQGVDPVPDDSSQEEELPLDEAPVKK